MITGADILVQSLQAEGVSVVFGYPGAAICPVYDSLSRSAIRHVLVRQEQNAGHAASGYGRLTGRPGVCITTSGPGATNLLTALATAYMDSIPMVAITGQVDSSLLGRDVFQEADITGASQSFTKYSYLVQDAADLPRIVGEAFYIAGTGRPGPVLIDLPVNVQLQRLEACPPKGKVEIRGYKPTARGNALQVKRVAQAIEASHRPLLCVGGGVISAGGWKELDQFAREAEIPVVTTLMGVGAISRRHPCYLGMLGELAGQTARKALAQADLLIVLGARLGDRAVSYQQLESRGQRLVHMDVDPAEIGKNLGTAIPLVGDCRLVLEQLLQLAPRAQSQEWMKELFARSHAEMVLPGERGLNPRWVVRELCARMPADGVIAADVGQNQMWTASAFDLDRGRLLTSGGMGTMGYSLPAALGAKLAAPDRQVAAICGDGSFQMQMNELATLVQEGAQVKILVMNNAGLGLVRQIQRDSYGGNCFGVSLGGVPDIQKIAGAYGIPAWRAADQRQALAGLEALLAEPGPGLLECIIDPCEPTMEKEETL